jgi:hypothetical protein
MGVLRNKTLQSCCVVKTYHPTFQADGHNTPHSANLHPNLDWTNHNPIRCNKSQHQTYMKLPGKCLQNTKIQDPTAHMFHPHIFTVCHNITIPISCSQQILSAQLRARNRGHSGNQLEWSHDIPLVTVVQFSVACLNKYPPHLTLRLKEWLLLYASVS